MTTSEKIKIRVCQIICLKNPEWGTWGVMADRGYFFEILGNAGHRILFKDEADKFWEVKK
jgi:hypothetical protein